MSLPWPLVTVLSGKAVAIASGIAGDPPDMAPFTNSFVVVRSGDCEKREWLCRGIGGALSDAAAYVHAHPQEALKLLTKRFSTLDPKLVAAAFALMVKVTPSPPAPEAAQFQNAERLNVEAGLLKASAKLPSYDALFTDKYVK
jgi:ABC-type nitrate/sulfonate/bicarbonate transport system substrate-binding protein